MRTDAFDYELPEELIASRPLPNREESRMMVVDRRAGAISHHRFAEFPSNVNEGDLVVFNDTRVVPARFYSDDGRLELLRLEETGPWRWKCLARPGKRLKVGREIVVGGVHGRVIEIFSGGERLVEFDGEIDEEKYGHLALPHYIGREDDREDQERYQTVYAERPGAIAAPTAGLHFTGEMVDALPHVFVTLHVGVGTFQPVRAEEVKEHEMHRERFEIGEEAARSIKAARRVCAVGTTVARVLEHCALEEGGIRAHGGETEIFIHPPYEFRVVDKLLTNFHLPKSTLFMLVCAFGGMDLMREAYREAVRERYRFFSYGDCMLIR